MHYVFKTLIALALAVLALPWPATVILRGLAMSVDLLMATVTDKAKDTKDSGVKITLLLCSALLALSGIWPAALLLAFLTLWHERLILWLFVRGLNIEDTRIRAKEDPPPEQRREAPIYNLRAGDKPAKQAALSSPQAQAACIKHGSWDPHEHGMVWDMPRQLWRDKDGLFYDMDANPVAVRHTA